MLRTRVPDWWRFWLDCAVTICHRILTNKIPISDITASTDLKLELPVILPVVHHVLRQLRWAKKDPAWHPGGERLV